MNYPRSRTRPNTPTAARRPTTRPMVTLVGATRRIQALVAYGYHHQQLADMLGTTPATVWAIAQDTYPQLRYRLAAAIAALYERLSARPAPAGAEAEHTRRSAHGRGWADPWRWDDDLIDDPDSSPWPRERQLAPVVDLVAIERYANGDRSIRLTKAERMVGVRLLHEAGYTPAAIARRLRMSSYRVWDILTTPDPPTPAEVPA